MMNKSVKVSVVIPIYNTENYLSGCVDSVLKQTYNNIEVLLIDDGSKDNSLRIAKNYAAIDSRIRVFHKKNGGVSSARNLGIEKSTGEYIVFVDSDDEIEKQYVETLLSDVFSNRMIMCGIVNEYKNGKKTIISSASLDKTNFRFYMYADNAVGGFCCNKIYNKKIISSNNISFNCAIKNCEDMLFNAQYSKYIDSFDYKKNALYHYRQRSDSATNVSDNIYYKEVISAIIAMRSIKGASKLDLLALDYMELELNIRCKKPINGLLLLRYIFDARLSLSRRLKAIPKVFFHDAYKKYSNAKRKELL